MPTRLWLSAVVVLAVICGAVLPRLALLPHSADAPTTPSPDPELWSFERAVANRESLDIAKARGQVREDPGLRSLREAVLSASSRLEFSPCDDYLRSPLRQAIGALLVELRDGAGQKREIATFDGAAVDATPFLNIAAAAIISEARQVGLVYREDLPAEVGILFPPRPPYPDSGRYGGRFACVDGGRG